MKKRAIYPTTIVLLTILLCAARLVELVGAFDENGLAVRGFALGFMRGSTAAALVAAALLAAAAKPNDINYELGFASGTGKVTTVAAGFLLAISGAVGLASGLGDTVRLVLSAFSLLGGVCMVLSVGAKGGALSVVPVFFCCFLLLMLYVEHSGDAVVERYGYQVLAAAASSAAIYCAASSSYGVTRSRFKLAAGGIALMLDAVAALTAVVDGDLQLAAAFLGCAVFAAGEVIAVSASNGIPEPEPKTELSEAEDMTEADDAGTDIGEAPNDTDGTPDVR